MIPFDDPDLLARVVVIETEAGTFRGIPLGSVWTVGGVVREDTLAANEWLAEKAHAASWVVDCYDKVETGDSVRKWYAAREPRAEIRLTHLGEGDNWVLGTCFAREAAAVVEALNHGGNVPVGTEHIVTVAIQLHETWSRQPGAEGTPWYTAEPVSLPTAAETP